MQKASLLSGANGQERIKSWESLQKITAVQYPIHGYIIMRELEKLSQVLGLCDPELVKAHIDEKDNNGNTPLLLAAKLCQFDVYFQQFVRLLFTYNANPKIKDDGDWRITDQEVYQRNIPLLAMIFDLKAARRKYKWERDKGKFLARLWRIFNFFLQMHWECKSDCILILSKIAPSDDLEIWKVGGNLRLDFSLVGFQKL